MKVNDAVVGVLLLALAGAIGWHIRGFPDMPGQKFGPAVFPGIIAAGLAVCGALLAFRGMRTRAPLIQLASWMRYPTLVANFLAICGALVFYIVVADVLGFVLTGALLLLGLFLKLGVPLVRAIVVAVVATLAIHALFYKLLKVPLPWGILQPVAW